MSDHPSTQQHPHLAHLVAGCWANGGGLSELVAATALAQAQQGHRVSLFFLGGQREHPLVEACRKVGVQVRIFKRSQPHFLYFSWELWRTLPRALRDVTHLYIYSCWTFPVWWGAACARKLKIPYSVAPQGCLDPVRRAYGKGRKWLAWQCFDRTLLRKAAWLHATAQQEASWMKDALGQACPPIRIVPNGVDDGAFEAVPDCPRTKTVLYLGRLHPLKGLDLLLEAWNQLNPPADWELLIAGPADGYTVPEMPQVRVLPPCYGEEKVKLLKSAAIFILPTRSENFGIVVAEALWCRTPVICTKGAPWEVLGEYWTDISAPALATALQSLIALTPEAREARFASLFDTAKTTYHWQTIARNLLP